MIMVNILALVNILLATLNIEVLGIINYEADIAQLPPSYYSDAGSFSQSSQPAGFHQQTYCYPYENYILGFYTYCGDDDNDDFVPHRNSMRK